MPDPYARHAHECVTTDSTFSAPWIGQWGTSFSVPVANAVATNVIAAGNFHGVPEVTRAVIMATAINVNGSFCCNGAMDDQKDGAGVVAASDAITFASTAAIVDTGNSPVVDGIGSGSIDSAEFVTFIPKHYNYRTPYYLPDGKHLRVVLTWSSSPSLNTPIGANEISDLGLSVESDGDSYYSTSWNNNVEMVDIPAEDLSTNTTYGITIYPWEYRRAEGGPNFFYYAVTWTWVQTEP